MAKREYLIHQEITDRLKTCDLFAIEDEVNHHAQHELNTAIHFPKGESLASVLSKEEYASLEAFFGTEFEISKKIFMKRYARIKPLALSIALTRLSLNEGVKFYDIELLKIAHDYRLPTYSLESVEREAEAFNAFPIEEQTKALMHSIQNFEKQKEEYKKLEKAYVKGDLDKVFEYSLHPFENNKDFIEEFYTKRNKEWLSKIESMLSENKAFITVGITHMEGENGLLTLLREKGYTLTPIPVSH